MENFIGTKEVLAKPMTKQEYNNYRGWTTPENENPNEKGYLVEYLDSPNSNHENHNNYISWSPKTVFDKSYKNISNGFDFGTAITFIKQGKLVTRKGWNGKGMFIFMRPADEIAVKTLVENVKSLPQTVKDYYNNQFKGDYLKASDNQPFTANFTAYICMKAADNTIVNGWLASQTDILAEDWLLFN